jgi:hypothetical protein
MTQARSVAAGERMSEFDPVPWDDIEAVSGPPAATVREYVEEMRADVRDDPPAIAVKRIYDRWKAEQPRSDRLPAQGAATIIAYELEREGVVELGPESGVPSLTERRPDADRLEALFWEEEYTMWWIGVLTGVHWALVNCWLYEERIPLQERNLTAETLAAIEDAGAE